MRNGCDILKIIKVAGNRVKIVITAAELEDMGIDIDDINAASPAADELFRNLMEAAEIAGFSSDEMCMKIEMLPTGSVTVIMTAAMPRKIQGVRAVCKNEYVLFEFSGTDALFGFLLNVGTENIADMRLYRYKGMFYIALKRSFIPMIIYEYSMRSYKMSTAENFASEYGEKIADTAEIKRIVRELKKIN